MLIEWLTFLVLTIYCYFTYLIAKESKETFISFTLKQLEFSHLGFEMDNKSRVEIKVFSKIWVNYNNEIFEFKKGFYADESFWILQPFTKGGGHFYLEQLKNKEGFNLFDCLKEMNEDAVKIHVQIKYKRVGSRKWKKSSPQSFIYDFNTGKFWLNV